MNIQQATNWVLEDLVDSDFRPGERSAYAYVTGRYTQLSYGRLGGAFLQIINQIDWDMVETQIKLLKDYQRQRDVDSVLDDMDFHANQIQAALKSVKIKDLGNASEAFGPANKLVTSVEDIQEAVAEVRENRVNMLLSSDG
jgi:hypothetical protein